MALDCGATELCSQLAVLQALGSAGRRSSGCACWESGSHRVPMSQLLWMLASSVARVSVRRVGCPPVPPVQTGSPVDAPAHGQTIAVMELGAPTPCAPPVSALGHGAVGRQCSRLFRGPRILVCGAAPLASSPDGVRTLLRLLPQLTPRLPCPRGDISVEISSVPHI